MPIRHIRIHLICNGLSLSTLGKLGNALLDLQQEIPEITEIRSSHLEYEVTTPEGNKGCYNEFTG